MNTVRLHVNVDHIATLRNARGTLYPDPIEGAAICLDAGADGITAHLREDRRHIKDRDVELLKELLDSRAQTFNLEMGATDEMVAIAGRVHPNVVTLVPERREERTTEGGLDVVGGGATLQRAIDRLRGAKIRVSLFIAPDPVQIAAAHKAGATQIELHTGDFAHAGGSENELFRLRSAAKMASDMGIEVAAGHGLTRSNVSKLVSVKEIVELNIGHAIIADAVFLSLREAVLEMRAAIALPQQAPQGG